MTTTVKMNFLSRLVGVMMNGLSTSKKKHKVIVQGNLAITGNLDMNVEVEDGGQAIIATASLDKNGKEEDEFNNKGVYARIISWDNDKEHKEMAKFLGRKIKVTIETID